MKSAKTGAAGYWPVPAGDPLPVPGVPTPEPELGAPIPVPGVGVPTPEPGAGAPTPEPGAGVPTPEPGAGVPTPEPGTGVPTPPLFVAGVHGSTLVPLLIVVGFVVVTDPVVAVGATLPALPEVPTVGVVDGAPGCAGADVPVVGATPVGVVLDAVVPGVAAVPVVAPGAAGPEALVAVDEVPVAFRDVMPLPAVGAPAGVPVTPATPGAIGLQGVSGVAR